MKQKKLNKKKLLAALIALIAIVICIIIVSLMIKKRNSVEYKLETIGYKEQEVDYIKSNFKDIEISKILEMKYSESLVNLSKEKYFRFDYLDEYIKYYNKTKNISYEELVRKINTNTNLEFYEKVVEADTSKNELMLVNKFYKLDENYKLEDIVLVSSSYAYSGKYISESIMENVINLIDDAKESGFKLIVSQGYRSYSDQSEIYERYKSNYGVERADENVARAGHSDYQTGLALDIEPYGKSVSSFEDNEEYIWLLDNAHRYGFIQRYPKDKESITGFKYDPWRLRYVGEEAATFIHNRNITFEEYYGYKF